VVCCIYARRYYLVDSRFAMRSRFFDVVSKEEVLGEGVPEEGT
jgi:hypothetical protein